jgi:hypothetical protein
MNMQVSHKAKWDSIAKLKGLNYRYIGDSHGYYVVDDGRVFSIAKGDFLKQFNDTYGYSVVNIYYGDGMKTRKVHRLVAEAFIRNDEHCEAVNHKNEIKNDNRAENLEWVTVKQNNSFGTRTQRALEKRGVMPVYEYSADGDFVKEFSSAASAASHYQCAESTVRNVCYGLAKSFNNRQFRYFKTYSITGLTERQKNYGRRYRKDGENSA